MNPAKVAIVPAAVVVTAMTAERLRRRRFLERLQNRFLRLRGPSYYTWLEWFHRVLRPDTYLEVGIFDGRSLALARPPTRAIGIDPSPTAVATLSAETHIFAETSDAFFADERLSRLLGDRPVDLAFIDGLHVFEQALRDFMNVEACASSRSVVLLHDVLPLDEPTQARERKTSFWTGDIWKVLVCLRRYRPDLDIFTIATFPSGLGVVSGLDPSSRALTDCYDEAVKSFVDMPFATIRGRMKEALNVVPNDWDIVASRLERQGIPMIGGHRAEARR